MVAQQIQVKDPLAADVLYVKALAAPFTINTMPERTLIALSEQTELGSIMAADGGDCEQILAEFANTGIDIDAMAASLQEQGANSFTKSWNELMAVIASKGAALTKAGAAGKSQ
jgi:transaldolase